MKFDRSNLIATRAGDRLIGQDADAVISLHWRNPCLRLCMPDLDPRRSILHIALQSGETYRSYRDSADDDAMAALRPLLESDGQHPLPARHGRSMWITRSGRLLLATVWADVPLCTFAIADQVVGSDKLWQMLHEDTQTVTHPDRPLPPPWCALRRESGLIGHPEDRTWLDRFERSLAWAWLDLKAPNRQSPDPRT
jgi:hypothetical protein